MSSGLPMELDATTMGVAGAVAVAVAGLAMFSMSGGSSSKAEEAAPAAKSSGMSSKARNAAAAAEKKKGSKKKGSKKKAAKPVAAPARDADEDDDDEEGGEGKSAGGSKKKKKKGKGTPEEREARRKAEGERALAKAQQRIAEQGLDGDSVDDDGFGVVVSKSSKKRKSNKGKKGASGAASDATPSGPLPVGMVAPQQSGGGGDAGQQQAEMPKITSTISVDARKLGAIIGPKGVTLNAIQEKAGPGTRVQLPQRNPDREKESSKPVTVTIEGTSRQSVDAARRAIDELNRKGYCMLLAEGEFSEAAITVPSHMIGVIMGSGGTGIRALQDALNVKIALPKAKGPARSNPFGIQQAPKKTKEKILIAGAKDGVAKCKATIREVLQYYHSAITHPGFTHLEMTDIEPASYRYIIGQRGSVMKHIQSSYKVRVNIPREGESGNPNLLVVGTPSSVQAAASYIRKVVAKANAPDDPAKAEAKAAEAEGKPAKSMHDDDFEEPGEHETWMDEFMYKRQ